MTRISIRSPISGHYRSCKLCSYASIIHDFEDERERHINPRRLSPRCIRWYVDPSFLNRDVCFGRDLGPLTPEELVTKIWRKHFEDLPELTESWYS